MPSKIRQYRISTLFSRFIGLISVATMLLLIMVYAFIEINDFSREETLLREKFQNAQRQKVSVETEKIIEYINLSRLFLEDKLNRQLYERTNEAYSTIHGLYNLHKDKHSTAEIKTMIKEALRPIRFNNGRGYYFIVSLKGVEELYPVNPKMEGVNLIELTDDMGNKVIQDELEIVTKFGEGFVTDYWHKPEDPNGMIHAKTSYVKIFEPLNWYVGCGEYLDDVQKDIQKEAITAIERVRFEYNGYAFAYTFEGDPIVSNNLQIPNNRNLWDTTDVNGVPIIQKMRSLVDNIEGGYLSYQWAKPNTDSVAPKIVYCKGIHDWEWIVGAGVYLDEIDNEIKEDRAHLHQQLYKKIFSAIFLVLIILTITSVIIRKVTRILHRNFSNFSNSLENSIATEEPLSMEQIQIEDIKNIAKEINVVIENKKEAVEKLRISEALFRVVFDHAPVVLIIFDQDLNPTRWNIEAEQYFILENKNSVNSITSSKPTNIASLQTAIFQNKNEDAGEFKLFDIETITGLRKQNWATFETESNETVAVGYDITELKKNEEELKNLNNAKDKIFSIISHDLHGPFNAIIGFAQIYLARYEKLTDEKKIKYVEQINLSAQNMHKQLINLLHWARMQTGNINVSIGKTNLHTLVDEIFSVLLPQAELKEIELKNNINPNIRVMADSSMLATVIQNLTSNAIKFTHKKGLVDISAITNSKHTTISITDNGIGMNKEQTDDLFNIAKTPRRRGTSNEMGTGLGLIICKEFVDKMSGEIWVESSVNIETTIYIKLPVAP